MRRPTTPDLTVVNVSLTGPERDYDTVVDFLHHTFRLVRVGTSGDVEAARELVGSWASEADAIAITGVREARAVGLYDGELDAIDSIKQATTAVPVSDGHDLGDVLQEWLARDRRAVALGLPCQPCRTFPRRTSL
mgnify:CR=1 FL=1